MTTTDALVAQEGAPSRVQFRSFGLLSILYAAITVAVIPFAAEPGPADPKIVVVYGIGILVADLCTAALLGALYRGSGRPALLVLTCTYLYQRVAHRRRARLAWALGHDLRAKSAPVHAGHDRGRVGEDSEDAEGTPADAVVQPASHDYRRPTRDVPLRASPRSGGKPAPDYVPPDKTPAGPYVQFPG